MIIYPDLQMVGLGGFWAGCIFISFSYVGGLIRSVNHLRISGVNTASTTGFLFID